MLASGASLSAQSADAVFRKFDRDGDGRVTSEELPSKPAFQRYDADKDGAISLAEYKAVTGNTPGESPLRRPGKKNGASGEMPSVQPEDIRKITNGPEILKPGELGIGRMITDVTFTDLTGKSHRLSDGRKGTVILMTSATCPVSKRYAPGVVELQKELGKEGLTLLLVNPLASEKPEEIKAQLDAAGITATMSMIRKKSSPARSKPGPRPKPSSWTPVGRWSTAGPSMTNTASATATTPPSIAISAQRSRPS